MKPWSRRSLVMVFLTTLLVTLPFAASAADWNFETLDGAGGPNGRIDAGVGRYNATLIYNGEPHVWYYDESLGNLRHAWWNGSTWNFEALDGAGGPNGRIDADVGGYNATLIYNGEPHVWYYDFSSGNLRHAWWNGSTWNFETLDGAGGPNGRIDAYVGGYNATLIYNGEPHVWYRDTSGGNLRHAWWNGSTWNFETLDGAGGPNGRIDAGVGGYNATLIYSGEPHVWYYDDSFGNLRHAWWNGSTWNFEALDGAGGPNGRIDANVGWYNATLIYNGEPHVWYRDSSGGNLRHAWWNGSTWNFEALDGAGGPNGRIDADVGWYNATLIYNGEPHVWYYHFSNLRHAWWNGSTWNFEALDGAGGPNGRIDADVGWYNATLIYNGEPHVWYLDASGGNLRHAWYG